MNLKKVLTTSFLITALGASAETTTNSQQVARPQSSNVSSSLYGIQDAFSNVYEKAKDSVVNIRTKKNTYCKYLQSSRSVFIWNFW